jgi:hypothetical protein
MTNRCQDRLHSQCTNRLSGIQPAEPQSAISAGTLFEREPGRHREMVRDTWL